MQNETRKKSQIKKIINEKSFALNVYT